jgi:type II restriction enzyme
MSLTANKGEWSELYVLYSLFADHKIPAADNNLHPTNRFYRFLKIFREDEPKRPLVYDLENDNEVIIRGGGQYKSISTIGLSAKTKRIFDKIKEATDATFSVWEAEALMKEFLLTKIKANSSEKSDLVATIKDDIVSETDPYGFSIKSQVGGASTLLNASSSGTNFIYKISDFHGDKDQINAIDTRSKVRDRLKAILHTDARLDFVGMTSNVFKENLRTVDSVLPNIVAQMLMNYYLGNGATMDSLCDLIALNNDFDLNKIQIMSKVKNFLKIVALGMVPQTPWNDRLSAYGGYIVVKDDGQLVCYHLYNEDAFKDYLFNNTKFDTPSSTRHNFGMIYERNDELFINLNLQIRFVR